MTCEKLYKSPLRYPGGKSRAIKILKQYFPTKFKEYREPFFGGGSVGLYLSQQNLNKNINFFANDLNYDVYCFWQILKIDSKNLIENIQSIKDNFQNGKELYECLLLRRDNKDMLQRAADFFILNRITFSGLLDCGGYSQKAFESRFTQSSIDRLKDIANVIQHFHFSHNDYSLELQKSGRDVFIFLDPPYFSATKSKLYGKKGDLHTGFNHKNLCEILKNTPHTFLLTYDNSEYIRNLYKDFYINEFSLQYGMNNVNSASASAGSELIISNVKLQKGLF